MKNEKKQIFNGLLQKLKTETLGVEHRAVISKILFFKNQYTVYRIPFDDYGDLMIDSDGVTYLYDRYNQLLAQYPTFKHDNMNGEAMGDGEYEKYCEYLSLRTVLQYIGVID